MDKIYCVDFAVGQGKNGKEIIIFEIQGFRCSNNTDYIPEIFRNNFKTLWNDFFSWKYKYNCEQNDSKLLYISRLFDVYNIFEKKETQRIAFYLDEKTRRYLPNFKIIHRYNEINIDSVDGNKLHDFYTKNDKKLVIKSLGCLSGGNSFFDGEDFTEVLNSINERIHQKKSMVVEAVVYLENEKQYLEKNTATYKRNIVVYDTLGEGTDVYPVYRQIHCGPDSHQNEDGQLKVKGYLEASPTIYFKYLEAKKNKETLALEKECFFLIGKSIERFVEYVNTGTIGEKTSKLDIFLGEEDRYHWLESLSKPVAKRLDIFHPGGHFQCGNYTEALKNLASAPNIHITIEKLMKDFPMDYLLYRNTLADLLYIAKEINDETICEKIFTKINDLYLNTTLTYFDYKDFLKSIEKDIFEHSDGKEIIQSLDKLSNNFRKKSLQIPIIPKENLSRLEDIFENLFHKLYEKTNFKDIEVFKKRLFNEINFYRKHGSFYRLKEVLTNIMQHHQGKWKNIDNKVFSESIEFIDNNFNISDKIDDVKKKDFNHFFSSKKTAKTNTSKKNTALHTIHI